MVQSYIILKINKWPGFLIKDLVENNEIKIFYI